MPDETALRRAIASAVRETINLARTHKNAATLHAVAQDYAEQLILPRAAELVQEALEEGFSHGRAPAETVPA